MRHRMSFGSMAGAKGVPRTLGHECPEVQLPISFLHSGVALIQPCGWRLRRQNPSWTSKGRVLDHNPPQPHEPGQRARHAGLHRLLRLFTTDLTVR